MFGKQRCDVLVVGAGPTGLTAALRLARGGINVRVVDRHWRTGAHSYALALHPRSLELLADTGVVERLTQHGRLVSRIGLWQRGELRAGLDLASLDCKYPFVLVAPQSLIEGELESALLQHKVKVQWNQRVERFETADDGLAAEISHLDRVTTGYPIARSEWSVVKSSTVAARYVVGADGYHSRIRELLGVGYKQYGPQRTFAVFECETRNDAGDALQLILGDSGCAALWPMRQKRVRWSFEVAEVESFEPTLNFLNSLIAERAPGFPLLDGDVVWSSLVQFDRRLADGMGRDRVWLAGDSAHLTGPLGVQSMNAGIVDAHELGWRLVEVLTGDRGTDVLSSYEAERMGELGRLFGDPGANRAPEGVEDWLAPLWPRLVESIPATGADLDALLSQLHGAV